MNKFDELFKLNVNDKIEKRKDGSTELSYLSWSWAWAKFKKVYPEATYEIKKFETVVGFEDGNEVRTELPYMQDPLTGYMVQTSITADGLTYEMWLPVMNSNNKAMKNQPYRYKVKEYKYENGKSKWTGNYIDKEVEAATMFDINKTIMRCLVKNMAMFGLGLYIYAGEDLPEKIDNTEQQETENNDIVEQIQNCESETELRKIYRDNKTKMTKDGVLLDLITKKANELKKVKKVG